VGLSAPPPFFFCALRNERSAGIGSAHDAVSTASKQAQAFYDQGLACLHSYVWLEAARSFNQALALDPKLALAHLFRFATEAEAIALANDTEFGLAAYFYGRDIARVWRVAEALQTRALSLRTGRNVFERFLGGAATSPPSARFAMFSAT
jgi:hypothetical protein